MLSRVHSDGDLLSHDWLSVALCSIACARVTTQRNTSYRQLTLVSLSLRLISRCYSQRHLRLHRLLSRILLHWLLTMVLLHGLLLMLHLLLLHGLLLHWLLLCRLLLLPDIYAHLLLSSSLCSWLSGAIHVPVNHGNLLSIVSSLPSIFISLSFSLVD